MATLDMWQLAPEASVALMASHTSESTTAASYTSCAIGAVGRVELSRNGKPTRSQDTLQAAAGYVFFIHPSDTF